jgi:iron complex outermembrane receptor protein
MFSDYRSVAQIAPSGSFFNTGDINCDSPLLSAQQSVAAIGCTADDILAGTGAFRCTSGVVTSKAAVVRTA